MDSYFKRLKLASFLKSSIFLKIFLIILLTGSISLFGATLLILVNGTETLLLYADPVTLLILFVGVLFLAFISSYLVVVPLLRLGSRLKGARSGEELAREARRNDEIGLLARSFQGLIEKIRRKEKWYQRIVDEATEVILILQGDKIAYANNATLKLLGFSPYEINGRKISEFVDNETVSLFERRRTDIYEGKVPFPMEIQIARNDGKKIWTEVETLPLVFDDRQSEMVIIRDIDKRKKLLEELEIQNRNLSLLFKLGSIVNEVRSLGIACERALDVILEESPAVGGFLAYGISKRVEKEKISVRGIESQAAIGFLNTISNYKFFDKNNLRGVLQLNRKDFPILLPWYKVIVVALMSSEDLVGFLVLGLDKDSPYPFNGPLALESLGRQLGLILDHICLIEKTELKANKFKELYRISLELSAALNFYTVLKKGIFEFKDLIKADRILAYRLEKDELRLLFHSGVSEKVINEYSHFRIKDIQHFKDIFPHGSLHIWRKDFPLPHLFEKFFDEIGAKAVITSSVLYDEANLLEIMFIFREKRVFLREEIDILKMGILEFASFLKTAILFEKVKDQNRILNTLNELFVEESHAPSWSAFLKTVYKKIRELMPLDSFFIALYDAQVGVLRSELSIERGKELKPFEQDIKNSRGLTGYVFKNKKPLLVRDFLTEKESLPVESIIIGEVNRSLIFAPLWVRGKAIGIISAQSFEPNAFDEDHLHLLSALGFQLGLILEKARLSTALNNMLSDLKKSINKKEANQYEERVKGSTGPNQKLR